jgi:type II secretory pathway pseudopilin PulG
MSAARRQTSATGRARGRAADGAGFTVIEVFVALTVLAVAILGVASMTATGHGNINDAGKATMALIAARQMLEDVRALPFNNVSNLNGFDTGNAATLPATDPERTIALKWRYTLAGTGGGFNFYGAPTAQWSTLSMGPAPAGLRGQITVVAQTPTRSLVTVRISFPGRWGSLQLATVIAQMA